MVEKSNKSLKSFLYLFKGAVARHIAIKENVGNGCIEACQLGTMLTGMPPLKSVCHRMLVILVHFLILHFYVNHERVNH